MDTLVSISFFRFIIQPYHNFICLSITLAFSEASSQCMYELLNPVFSWKVFFVEDIASTVPRFICILLSSSIYCGKLSVFDSSFLSSTAVISAESLYSPTFVGTFTQFYTITKFQLDISLFSQLTFSTVAQYSVKYACWILRRSSTARPQCRQPGVG